MKDVYFTILQIRSSIPVEDLLTHSTASLRAGYGVFVNTHEAKQRTDDWLQIDHILLIAETSSGSGLLGFIINTEESVLNQTGP